MSDVVSGSAGAVCAVAAAGSVAASSANRIWRRGLVTRSRMARAMRGGKGTITDATPAILAAVVPKPG